MSGAFPAVVLANVLRAAEAGHDAPDDAIFFTRAADGKVVVLARFSDAIWTFPDSLFPRTVAASNRRIDFGTVPAPFKLFLKGCVLRFYLYGHEGGVRPRGATIVQFYKAASLFLRFLERLGVADIHKVSQLTTAQYVGYCRQSRTRAGRPLSPQRVQQLLGAVEALHKLSRFAGVSLIHPWPESSAFLLSGNTSPCRRASSTPLIPDDILAAYFQFAERQLDRADEILRLRDQVEAWKGERRDKETIRNWLKKGGYAPGAQGLKEELEKLLTACMAIVFITSGIRSHEFGSLDVGCCRVEIRDGQSFYWLHGRSDKTGEGPCRWLVPAIARRALAIAERVTAPLRAELARYIEGELRANPGWADAAKYARHRDAVFLARWTRAKHAIGAFTLQTQNTRLKNLARSAGLSWSIATHQFRRAFAVYAAHNVLGDLRYLRDHFKHWTLDMTAVYAAAEDRDEELIDEIGLEIKNQKVAVVEHWLERDTKLSGGMAGTICTFRNSTDAVLTCPSRRELAIKISDLVHIRATGVAWCTADSGGCNGGQGVERTRCAGCRNAVIDDRKKPIWQAIYVQQLELNQLVDIGPAGKQRVERDRQRCVEVLTDLGANPEDLIVDAA